MEKPEEWFDKLTTNGWTPVRLELSDDKDHETIPFEEFVKVHLTVGTIEQCEEIPQSDKLYKLQVNFGALGMRQILSGIRKSFKPEDLVGKQAVFVTNLKPRKMMGLESQGMLLTAQDENNAMSLLAPKILVPNGTRLK